MVEDQVQEPAKTTQSMKIEDQTRRGNVVVIHAESRYHEMGGHPGEAFAGST
jgi:hypothetical protein